MRRVIRGTGCEVIHLGHDKSAEEVVNTAIQEDANAIALTSYQGGHNEYFKYIYDLLEKNSPHQNFWWRWRCNPSGRNQRSDVLRNRQNLFSG
jgi:methylmalonyl-CoA mutase cobalamin-binding subunit